MKKETPFEILHKLEQEHKYVFHGSGLVIEEFEPRQAHSFRKGKHIPDGEPAVFASQFADYAIFMALINRENCPKGYHSGVSYTNGSLNYRATKDTLEQLTKETSGYVYVFDKKDFKEKNDSEWVSHKRMKPSSVIIVGMSDFSEKIEEIED